MSTADDKAEEARKIDQAARRGYCQTFGHQYVMLTDLTAVVCSNRCGMVALTGRAGIDLVRKMWPTLLVLSTTKAASEDTLEKLRAAFPQYAILPKTQVPAKPTLFIPPNASGR